MRRTRIALTAVVIIVGIMSFVCAGCMGGGEEADVVIMTTVYAPYDFAREITKGVDGISIKMLITPGAEAHTFEPTPRDIISLEKCDLFIYAGGENDVWVEDILDSLSNKDMQKVVMTDCAELLEEELGEGMEGEEEQGYDEHVWTSLRNSQAIVTAIAEKLAAIDAANAEAYYANAELYNAKLDALDTRFRIMTETAERDTVIFADRFPIRYFVEDYGLSYYAAFPGCSHETEASAKTVTFLSDKVKELRIPVIFVLELSNGKIAQTVSEGTSAKTLTYFTCHNVSAADFQMGLGYYDMMEANYISLSEALN